MTHPAKLLLCAVLASLPGLAAVGATLEFSPEKLNIAVPENGGTTIRTEAPRALVIESDSPKGFCEFFARGKTALPAFEVIQIDVRLDRARTTPLQNFSIRLQDASGETLQYTLAGMTLPEGDTLRFTIDRRTRPFTSWGGNGNGKLDLPAKIAGGTFRFRNGGKGTLVLRGVSAEVKETALAAPETALKLPENRLPVFDPAQGNAALTVTNPNPVPVEAEIAVTIRNMATGQTLPAQTAQLKLAAAGSAEFPFPLPREYGVYELSYSAALPGKTDAVRSDSLRFGCMVPAKKGERGAKDFLFGICSQHLPRLSPELAEREIAAIALCGADIVRFCSYWDIMEPRRGEFNFKPLDSVVGTVEKYGLKSQVLHSRLPRWATAAGWKPLMRHGRTKAGRALPDFDAWRTSIRKFTGRYKGRINYAEIWNEPDLYSYADFTTDDYLKLLKAAAEEIRANDPATVVLTGGFATIPPPNWTSGNADIVKRTLREGRNDYDIFALHNHSLLPHCVASLDRFDAERKAAGSSKPWYMNEAGLSTRSNSETAQAAEMFRKILYCRARGAMAYNWYALRNDGWDKSENEDNFGILLTNFEPKLSYITFNMLTGTYAGSEFRKTAAVNDAYMSLLFKGKDGHLFANFPVRNDRTSRFVAFSGITGKAWKIDLFGNSAEVPVKDGVAIVGIGGLPHTLKVTGKLPTLHEEPVRFSGSYLIRGRKNLVRLHLVNPSDREQTYRFTPEAPASLRIAQPSGSVKIAPRSAAQLDWEVIPALTRAAAGNGKLRAELGSMGEITLDLPFEYVNEVAHGAFRTEPDYRLNSREQVSIQVPSAHEYAGMIWSGPEDCSADVFLAEDGKNLKLRVDVTDDRHVQKQESGSLWMGDSIQFVVAPTELRGYWRFGFSLREDGTVDSFLWDVPNGCDAQQALAVTQAEVSRDDVKKRTRYEITMPLRMLDTGEKAFRFNLLVNDNDGTARESFITLAPGLGRDFDVNQYPLLMLKEKKK